MVTGFSGLEINKKKEFYFLLLLLLLAILENSFIITVGDTDIYNLIETNFVTSCKFAI